MVDRHHAPFERLVLIPGLQSLQVGLHGIADGISGGTHQAARQETGHDGVAIQSERLMMSFVDHPPPLLWLTPVPWAIAGLRSRHGRVSLEKPTQRRLRGNAHGPPPVDAGVNAGWLRARRPLHGSAEIPGFVTRSRSLRRRNDYL